MLIDLHNHTIPLSIDSGLRPTRLIELARERGLDGICLTEHDRLWKPDDLARLCDETGFLILAGCEVTTRIGHVLAFGLRELPTGHNDLTILRQAADRDGAVLVAAHPLRAGQRIADHSHLLPLFDGVEAYNGTESNNHNSLAAHFADSLDCAATGGSDAHADYEIAVCATSFESSIACEADLIAALREKRCRPVDLRAVREGGHA